MKKSSLDLHRQKGFLALEAVIIMIMFFLVMVLANNGIVNVVHQEWSNAAQAGAMAGAEKLRPGNGSSSAEQQARDAALTLTLLHTWLGKPLNAAQVTVTLGVWNNCQFRTSSESAANAVRVEIAPPVDAFGNPTGLLAFFGRIQNSMFQSLESKTTAIAAVLQVSSGNNNNSNNDVAAFVSNNRNCVGEGE